MLRTADGEAVVNMIEKTGAVKSAAGSLTGPTTLYTDRRHPTVVSLLHAQRDDGDGGGGGGSWRRNNARSRLVQSSTSTTFSLVTIVSLLRLYPHAELILHI